MFIMFMVHHYIIYSVIFLQLNKLLVAKECGCSDVIHWSDESKLTKNYSLRANLFKNQADLYWRVIYDPLGFA